VFPNLLVKFCVVGNFAMLAILQLIGSSDSQTFHIIYDQMKRNLKNIKYGFCAEWGI
jgi:hypothetical protein